MFIKVVQSLFFFLPGYIANMFPVVLTNVRWMQFLKKPVDCGVKIGKMSLFGEHKTYFGFLAGVFGGVVVGVLQGFLYEYSEGVRFLYFTPYSLHSGLFLGFLLGFGALFGDLIKSFIKRRFGIANGRPFFPFDQLDFVIGGLLFGTIVYSPTWDVVAILLVVSPFLHFLSNLLGYFLGLKKVWW